MADGHLNFDTQINSDGFNKGISKLSGLATKGMAVIGTAAAAAFGAMTKAALNSVASLEQNLGGVETLFKDSANTVIENANKAYMSAGMSANEYMSTVTSFSASLLQSLGNDTAKAAKYADTAIIDMSDNANKMGTSMELIQNAYQGFAKQNYTMLDNLKLGYGGTKSEMERLIADANRVKEANGEMADLSIDSFADVTEAIHIIQTEMGITGTTVAEAASTIEGSMNAAKAAWDNFLNGSSSAQEFATAFSTAVENIVSNLGVIVPRLVGAIPVLITSLAPVIVQAGIDIVSYIVQGLGLSQPQVIQQSLEMMGQWIDTALSFLPTIITTGFEIIESLLLGLLQNAPNIIVQAVTMLTEWVTKILNMLPTILQSGSKMILSLLSGLIANAPQIISQAATMLANFIATIGANLPGILQKGIEIIAELLAGIISKVPDLIATIPGIIADIGAAFLNTDWGSIGLNIIQGIANGILSGIGTIVSAARDAASRAFESAKSFLGIQSPSRLFRDQIGKMMALGMGLGFEKNIPVKEMTYGLKNAVKSLEKDVAITTSARPGKTVGGIKATPGFFGTGTDWDEWERRQRKLNKERDSRPVYLGTERIDKELPKGVVLA